MQNGTATLEESLVVSYKTEHLLICHPAFVFLDIYPKGIENLCLHNTCTLMFIAALFITVKIGKQPSCPVVGECLNNLWYIQIMACYFVLKRNEL